MEKNKEQAIRIEPLRFEDVAQLLTLQNEYKAQIGEGSLTSAQAKALEKAIRSGAIRFFVARQDAVLVGMCSVCQTFSTFDCALSGIFEDFYIQPAFRKRGVARALASFAQKNCAANGVNTLWVGASEGDKGMYEALGFSLQLGALLTWCKKQKSDV